VVLTGSRDSPTVGFYCLGNGSVGSIATKFLIQMNIYCKRDTNIIIEKEHRIIISSTSSLSVVTGDMPKNIQFQKSDKHLSSYF
jgi:hypothetical protein